MSSESVRIYNDPAALAFSKSLRDPRARGGLICLHRTLLKCFYSVSAKENIRPVPTAPLDELVLYQAVAELFSRWDGAVMEKPPIADNDRKLVNLDRALAFAHSARSQRVRLGLENLITVFLGMHLPSEARIDVLFCCRLLYPCLENDEVFSNILNGAIVEDYDRLENDYDYWLNAWFGPRSE
jgi:hypothetical protein